MTIQKKIFVVLCFLTFCAVSFIGSVRSYQQTAGELYEKALYYEEAQGDLRKAVDLYKKILDQFPENREIAAKAQLHIGLCFEKLGHTEAVKAYELVVQNFADQKEPASTARARLAELTAKNTEKLFLEKLWSMGEDKFLLEAQSLSPDGTKLLGINVGKGQNVAYKDLNTQKCRFITNFDWKSEGHGWTYNPVWSPASDQVAFNFRGWDGSNIELRIADLEGESKTIYRCETENENIYPCGWFPDSQKVLAIHITQDNAIRLGKVPAQGQDFQLIYEMEVPADARLNPDAGRYFRADLSPDGERVVFHKNEDKTVNLYVMNIKTKALSSLTNTLAKDRSPQWSPDGKHVAFLSDRTGNQALWAIPVDKDGSPGGQPFLLQDSMEHANLLNWTEHGLPYENWVSSIDIFVLQVDPETGAPTGKPKQLDYRPTGDNFNPVYSPDGKFLAFVSNLEDREEGRHIVVYPLSGGEPKSYRIPSSNFRASLFDLRWLPDGSGIGFSGTATKETPGWNEELNAFMVFKLKLETGEWQTWPIEPSWARTEWRKDGEGIYYGMNAKDINPIEAGIIEKDLNTGAERYIYKTEDGASGVFREMKCSRDYTKLAFYQGWGNFVHVIDVQSGETLYKFPNVYGAAWSPDGTQLMTTRGFRAFHVFSLADGTKQEYDMSEYLPEGGIRFFDWSPEGNQVAYSFMFRKYSTHLIRDIIPASK